MTLSITLLHHNSTCCSFLLPGQQRAERGREHLDRDSSGQSALWPLLLLWEKTPAKQPDSPKNSFSTACLFNPGCKWQQTSIKERDFHLCVTRICAYHTVREHKAIYSGLWGRCHVARVKCCRVGVKQLQISCVCAEECCVFVQRLTNRTSILSNEHEFKASLAKKKQKTPSLSTNES